MYKKKHALIIKYDQNEFQVAYTFNYYNFYSYIAMQ